MDEELILEELVENPDMEILEEIEIELGPSEIEERLGEIIDTGEGIEQIPDLIGDILEGEPFNEIPFEEIPEDEWAGIPLHFDGLRDANGPRMEHRRSNDTYSKFDSTVIGIQISPEKLIEIRNDVMQETEDRITEKTDEVIKELVDIRSDIEHYKKLLDDLDKKGNPSHLRSMTSYQLLRFEIDAACRKYEKAGGEVGPNCFLQNTVSVGQLGMSMIDVLRTNAFEGAIVKKVLDIDIGYNDIYFGTKSGESILGKLAQPFISMGEKIGVVPGRFLYNIFQELDAHHITSDKADDVEKNKTNSEATDDIDTDEQVKSEVAEEQTIEETRLDSVDKHEDASADAKDSDIAEVKAYDKIEAFEDQEQIHSDIEGPQDKDLSDQTELTEQQKTEDSAEPDLFEKPAAEDSPDQKPLDMTDQSETQEENKVADGDTVKESADKGAEKEPIEKPADVTDEEDADLEEDSDLLTDPVDSEETAPEEEIISEPPSEAETEKTDTEDVKKDAVVAETDEEDSEVEEDTKEESEDSHANQLISDREDATEKMRTPMDESEQKDSDDYLSIDTDSQNNSLSETEDLAVESLPTGETDLSEYTPDSDEKIMDIVDNTVKAIEDGIDESEVLSDATSDLAKFYESQKSDDAVSVEDTVIRIADAVHEMASVFETPSEAAGELMKGIPDETMADAIYQQIDVVDAEMTTEATGSFGVLEYDDAGRVFDTVDYRDFEDIFETDGFDVDNTILELENHMDKAVEAPDIQDLLANDSTKPPMDVDSGLDSGIDAGVTGSGEMAADVISGIEAEGAEILLGLL